MKSHPCFWSLLLFALLVMTAGAQEVISNGKGGGKWSDPGSWREGKLPSATDAVVISTGDKITFNAGAGQDGPTCASLHLDPESILDFEVAAGHQRLRVAGEVIVHGLIRMDGTLFPEDRLEILLDAGGGDTAPTMTLNSGGGLSLSGAPGLPEGRRNVVLARTERSGAARPVSVTTGPGAAIDIKEVRIEKIAFDFNQINNTGLRPNERLNLTGNRFVDASVTLRQCDTPRFLRNEMRAGGQSPFALHCAQTTLPEIVGNRIDGYARGIIIEGGSANLSRNTVVNADQGLTTISAEVTFREGHIGKAKTAALLRAGRVTLEAVTLEAYHNGIDSDSTLIQLINTDFKPDPEAAASGMDLNLTRCAATLVNSNVPPERVRSRPIGKAPVGVNQMCYLVVRVQGQVPPEARVKVEPADPKNAGPYDVRNSPAPIRPDGMTPSPQTVDAIVIQSWSIDPHGKLHPPKAYNVSVILPAADEKGKPTVLKSVTVTPDESWYRPSAQETKANVEITL